MIWLLTTLAFAEPLMTSLEEGEQAPFAGRLLNDEALTSLILAKQEAEELCSLEENFECNLKLAEKQLELEYMKIDKESCVQKHDALMEIKNKEIETLNKIANPKVASWVFLGGFIVGTGTSLATYYAINQIAE